MIGKTISHYKITEKLGAGGMGEVYLADDLKLDRKVAIKFLPEHLTKDKDIIERFEREAKATAALNHPNIVTIYDVIESDDQICIVMEYVDGNSLRTKIGKGVSDLNEILSITKQICEGLSEAHNADIVHRDIKPENILINNRGRVKILDFGLAKLKGVSKLTKETSTMGTVHYMSPEQIQGKNADHRSDIWSLGVVLHELLTGEAPFKGDYESAVQYAILNEEPENLEDNIPNELMKVVNKCLHKNPANRYQSTEELLQFLKTSAISSKKPDKKEKSIIALPFVNMSPDPEQEYFSDGLTEEIITDLSYIHDLLVISRSSAMTFKGTKKKIKEIASEVNVQYVLEGSVRKAGNNLRITAQLIDATTDAHLWAERYSGTLDDVFDIQEKVSQSIANALKLKLTSEENEKILEHPIIDVYEYEYYIKARQEIHKATSESLRNALHLIENRMEIVGKNVILLASLGYAHWMLFNAGIDSDEKHLAEAEHCAEQIFKLDSDSALGYRLLGLAQIHRGKIKESIQNLHRAIQKEPNDPDSLTWLCVMLSIRGKIKIARSLSNKLIQIDPLSSWGHLFASLSYYYDGQFFEAVKLTKTAYEMEPKNPVIITHYFLFLATAKKYEEANDLIDESYMDVSDNFFTRLPYFLKYAIKNDKAKALQIANENFKNTAKNDLQFSSFLAEGFSLLNEGDEAIKWLENAVNRGFINYPFLNEYDPFLENIRGEERFKKLMKRVKVEWENFEV